MTCSSTNLELIDSDTARKCTADKNTIQDEATGSPVNFEQNSIQFVT